jgi:hypothetical protein
MFHLSNNKDKKQIVFGSNPIIQAVKKLAHELRIEDFFGHHALAAKREAAQSKKHSEHE